MSHRVLNAHKHALYFSKGTCQNTADASSTETYLALDILPKMSLLVANGKCFFLTYNYFIYIEFFLAVTCEYNKPVDSSLLFGSSPLLFGSSPTSGAICKTNLSAPNLSFNLLLYSPCSCRWLRSALCTSALNLLPLQHGLFFYEAFSEEVLGFHHWFFIISSLV